MFLQQLLCISAPLSASQVSIPVILFQPGDKQYFKLYSVV